MATIRKSAKGSVEGFVCDVAKAGDTQDAYDKVMAAFGKMDILVNNAGKSRLGAFETITDEMWQDDIEQKLMGAIRMTRLVWPQMKERRWGRVINVLSINAKSRARGGAPDHSVARRRAGADQGAGRRGRAAQRAGQRADGRLDRLGPDRAAPEGAQGRCTLEDMIAEVGKEIPLGRMGRAEEFANVGLLPGLRAASYIAGTAIPVDGGKAPFI